jgi:hypothetical protein
MARRRIGGANAGWKGRLWATTSTRTPFHMETGKGTPPMVTIPDEAEPWPDRATIRGYFKLLLARDSLLCAL